MSKRIEWVDVCKGFAMVLVMMGHTSFSTPIKTWLYTFHVPLFFFLSGYVFSVKRYSNFKEFLIAKMKTLIVPMVILGLSAQIISYTFKPDMPLLNKLFKMFLGIFIELRGSGYDAGPWFVECLFVVQIAYWFILKKFKNNLKAILMILLALSIIGYSYMNIIDKILPWSVDASLIAIGFFGLGYLTRNHWNEWLDNIVNLKWFSALLVINLIITYINLKFKLGTDLYSDSIDIYPLYYIGASSGILLSISFFRMIKPIQILKFIGANTFIYYAYHGSIYSAFDVIFKTLSVSNQMQMDTKGAIYVIFSSLIIALISVLINRYTPWVLGKKKE